MVLSLLGTAWLDLVLVLEDDCMMDPTGPFNSFN
jgi:hypothetical protein